MTTLRVTFEDGRVGRTRGVEPQEFEVSETRPLSRQLHRFVRQYLRSREVELDFFTDGTGEVVVGGFRTVGRFIVEEVGRVSTYRGRWQARVEQDFEIEAESREEFERAVAEEMSPRNVVELMDFEYEVEEVITDGT